MIKEKNDQIIELQQNLGQEENVETFGKHKLEDPDHIFQIDEKTEIKVERFYTKEQREAMEEEAKRQREREALLAGDNVNQRGLMTMMGGNELIMKKEKNKLEDELVREDWMNKPETEMTEDEKVRLREFEQRVKDSIEK